MSTLKVDNILKRTGTGTITLGQSGDTISIPSGTTLAVTGTATGVGGVNTPSFHAYLSGNQSVSDNTLTVLACNTEVFDTASKYDTSNYRFTPTAGKYFIYGAASVYANHVSQLVNAQINIRKNGSTILRHAAPDYRNNSIYGDGLSISSIVVANGTDYFEIMVKINDSSNAGCVVSGNSEQPTYFGAFKIIE